MKRSPEEILVRPVITEKTSALQFDGTDAPPKGVDDEERTVRSKYTFEVVPDATKVEVRQAVEEMFDVRVTDVKTMNVRGKSRRVRGRWEMGRRPHWKKAVVTVGEDDVIDLYEGV
jgi:large subunit ribosomal protein L23